jgi:hypothetical protein
MLETSHINTEISAILGSKIEQNLSKGRCSKIAKFLNYLENRKPLNKSINACKN